MSEYLFWNFIFCACSLAVILLGEYHDFKVRKYENKFVAACEQMNGKALEFMTDGDGKTYTCLSYDALSNQIKIDRDFK